MGLSKPQSKLKTTLTQPLNTVDGVVYINDTIAEGSGYLVLERGTSNEEILKYTTAGTGYVSGCTRALSTVGTTETAGSGKSHSVGSSVEMTNVHYYFARVIDAINGLSSTSANDFIIGPGTGSTSAQSDLTYSFQTSAGLTGAIRLSATGVMVWTEDAGISWNRLSATGGAVNTGDGWENVGGIGNVVVADLISATAGISSTSDNFTINKAWQADWTGNHTHTGTTFEMSATNFNLKGTKVSALAEEINRISGLSAYSNVSPYKLEQLVDGGSISASSFHTHGFRSGTGSRATSAGNDLVFINCGFQPKLIEIYATSITECENTYTNRIETHGWYTEDGSSCAWIVGFKDGTGAQGILTGITGNLIYCYYLDFGWTGNIDSIATSGFSLAITEQGTTTADLSYMWKAQN